MLEHTPGKQQACSREGSRAMIPGLHVLLHGLEEGEAGRVVKVGIAHAGDIVADGSPRRHAWHIVGVMGEHSPLVRAVEDHVDQVLVPAKTESHVAVDL